MGMVGLSSEQIVKISKQRDFYVHCYRDTQRTLRKKCRRLCAEGILELIRIEHNSFVYRSALARTKGRVNV